MIRVTGAHRWQLPLAAVQACQHLRQATEGIARDKVSNWRGGLGSGQKTTCRKSDK